MKCVLALFHPTISFRFAACSIYYGVVWMSSDRLGGNRYVNFLAGTVMEVPALVLSIYVSERY